MDVALKRFSDNCTLVNQHYAKLPVLKTMHHIVQRLMMNELEAVVWLALNEKLYMLLDRQFNKDICQHLSMTAILVKEKLAPGQDFVVLQTFLRHNYADLMASYEQWAPTKKTVLEAIPFQAVNALFKRYFTNCFAVTSDQAQDYNFIVDCLEDEHLKREVHTVKQVQQAPEPTLKAPVAKKPARKPSHTS